MNWHITKCPLENIRAFYSVTSLFPTWNGLKEKMDFQQTDKMVGYKNWTMSYIWRWGKRLMTSFKDKLNSMGDYFSEEELEATQL